MAACDQRDFSRGTCTEKSVVHPALNILDDLAARRARFMAPLIGWLGKAEAEDALQDAYVRVLTKPGQLRRESSADAWFRHLLRSAAIDRLRRSQAERRAVTAMWVLAEPPAALADTPSPCECLYDVLDKIHPAYAHVLRRVDLEGGDVAAVAVGLGITRNNLRVRLHRARRLLRARLLAVCGVCAQRGCQDCICRRSGGSNAHGSQ